MMILWDIWTELITELRTLQDSPCPLLNNARYVNTLKSHLYAYLTHVQQGYGSCHMCVSVCVCVCVCPGHSLPLELSFVQKTLSSTLQATQIETFSLNPMCCGDQALPPLDDVSHFPCGVRACALCICKFLSEYHIVILPL